MAVSKRLRYEILRRDNHACRYCGASAPDARLTIDHVVAVALGGSDDPDNLVAACVDCNSGKSATPADASLVADVALDALRWARAMQWAADEHAREATAEQSYIDAVDQQWLTWTWTDYDGVKHGMPRPTDWIDSCRQWRKAGADIGLVLNAVDISMRNTQVRSDNLWRYTAGVVWARLRDQQDLALQYLNRQPEA